MYVPATVKVWVYVAPGAIWPESKPAGPLTSVTVWSTESRLVQVTLEPTAIVIVEGEYAKFWISTAADAASAGAATTRGMVDDPARAATTATARTRRWRCVMDGSFGRSVASRGRPTGVR